MAKTWGDLLDEARTILQDEDEPYRYSDAILRSKLNRGLQELARLRPDALYDRFNVDDVVVPIVAATDADPDTDPTVFDPDEDETVTTDENVDLPMQFYTALVYFTAGSAELVDDEFTTDGRAALLLTQFKGMVLGL